MSWLIALEDEAVWTGVSGCVLACLDGHRFGGWPASDGSECPVCGGTLRIEQDDE